MIPKQSQRLVLDTNVCLDLFVFHDPRWQSLLQALQQGQIEAVTRTECRMEWLLVLAYEKFQLDAALRSEIAAEFDALIRLVDMPAADAATAPTIKLPLCRDPDDQKFLELAQACAADVLISKDKALLKLARKTERAGLFKIMTPETWVASYQQ